MGKKQGIVKFFLARKGYGFIESEGQDFFVHYNSIVSPNTYKVLNEGDKVEFEVEEAPKGLQAVKVVKISDGITEDELNGANISK